MKNVLFLIADDLRPNLDVYQGLGYHLGQSHTPNLDQLAKKSILFQRAYVQYALCSPSRTSFLTGRRPDTTQVYDLQTYFRTIGNNFTTMPQYFKEHGYQTEGMGKIFHPGKASNNDDPPSWNKYHHDGTSQTSHNLDYSWKAVNDSERSHNPLVDEVISKTAKEVLQTLSSGSKPFFLAVGFHKPHLPFEFPEKFLSYFPEDNIQLPSNEFPPHGMPDIAWSRYRELRSYRDISALHATGESNTLLPHHVVRELRRAYICAVAYMDSLVGEILAEVKRLNLESNTVISFIGDHGFSLGEHGLWSKDTNFEDVVHAPMMISVPGLTDNGVVTNQLVEHVDLFPTLVEVAGLPLLHTCPEHSHLDTCTEGTSMVPLIHHPLSQIKQAAFSQTFRHRAMGYSIRTDRYRYTEWPAFDSRTKKPDFTHSYGSELYDHVNDKEENNNIVARPENAQIVTTLRDMLRKGWRSVSKDPSIIG
ncbi:hypothetical protein LOTGIDRAFT_165917 [Lottia gigantea]|uniref:Sulfatase N-terminal domain-containing protein n=1 Tax=Lottia gigantea TaxID=225164 RepID=V4BHI8_LOTGI|nr:hypothetical protein LOTGIDRAFT_165917 [Lottia gigantea]ESO88174.1 hypothetical protein LOTGIDRAFT_165917 [Lottia gigantea]